MSYSKAIGAFLDKAQAAEEPDRQELLGEACALLQQIQTGMADNSIDAATPSQILPRKDEVEKTCRGIGHDFNGILANIRGLVEITQLMAPDAPEKVQETFNRILNLVDRGHHSTELVRLYGKVLSYEKSQLDLQQSLRRLLNDIKFLFHMEEPIEYQCPQNLLIDFDEMQFEAMLTQLLKNALHAVKDKPDPVVKVHCEQRSDGQLEIQVIDNGIGIAPDVGDKVYFPFYRTKKATEGLGLGLSIAKQIVMNHDGHIHYYSQQGVGSTFTCVLPVVSS